MKASKAERIAMRRLYIPANARLVPGPAGVVIYRYESAGRIGAMCFWGSAAKPTWHYRFKDESQFQAEVERTHTNVIAHAKRKADESAAKKAWQNDYKVGEIVYTSWGYDQTNTDFYVITKTAGKRVWVRKVKQDTEATGWAMGECWPAMPIEPIGPETMHIASKNGFSIDGHCASRETGRSHYFSSYA